MGQVHLSNRLTGCLAIHRVHVQVASLAAHARFIMIRNDVVVVFAVDEV